MIKPVSNWVNRWVLAIRQARRSSWLLSLSMALCLLLSLSGCNLPQIKAEDRLFLPLSLEFLGAYQLPKQEFQSTRLGGLSGLTYDPQLNQLYAVSDDRSNFSPARFYTVQLATVQLAVQPEIQPETQPEAQSGIQSVTLQTVTALSDRAGAPYLAGSLDPEGIALSPRQSLFISSEGDSENGIAPFIDEFDLKTGAWRSSLPIPERYLPNPDKTRGVQNNQGFESLTISAISSDAREPFRLFAAVEGSLQQDLPSEPASNPPRSLRFLHYLVGETQNILLSEHLYPLEPLPEGDENLGLSDLLVLDQSGHFLSLERSFGLSGFGGKIFQLATGGATDIAPIDSLSAGVEGIMPIQKRLLLDLGDLGIPLDNYEGLSLGPQLPDGSRSLILVSDDNFNPLQVTEFLLFRLKPA